MKDTTFSLNGSGTPSTAINHEYIKGVVNQLLFTKKTDEYSNRGIDLAQVKYKNVSEVNYLIPVINDNFQKYTDMMVFDVKFSQIKNILFLNLTLSYLDQLIQIAINTDTKSIGFLPVGMDN